MTQRRLKFALVGCGRASGDHLEALTGGEVPAELVAVCDTDEPRARGAGAQSGVPWYLDSHEMLDKHPEVEAIDVATPTGYHAAHAIDLARYGKPIVVEKPMALSVADCQAMIADCRKHRVRLFVVQQNRFNPAVVETRRALDAGRFGRFVMGTVRMRWRRDQSYYEADHCHGTWELDGGEMAQAGGAGAVPDRQAPARHRGRGHRRGAVALPDRRPRHLRSHGRGAPQDLEASLSLLGEKGSVIISGRAVNRITYGKFSDEQPGDSEMVARHAADVPTVYGHGHGPDLAHVVDCIVNERPGLVEGSEGEKNAHPGCAPRVGRARRGAAATGRPRQPRRSSSQSSSAAKRRTQSENCTSPIVASCSQPRSRR